MNLNRIILFALLAGCAAASPQTERESSISIVNRSPGGSPLLVKGDVTAFDKPTEQLRFSVKGSVSITNVSSKPILLTVVSLKGTNVPGVDQRWSQDYYFDDLFEPQSTDEQELSSVPFVSRMEVKSSEGTQWVDMEPSRTAQQQVTASVLFVQFADGSTWGNRDEAKTALEVRRDTVKRLLDLESIYRREGEAALIEDLSKPSDLPTIWLLQDFCKRSDDKSRVVDRLLRLREASDDHARMVKPTHGKP